MAGFAIVVGLDRERALYPIVLIMAASYYVLFAVMAATEVQTKAQTQGLSIGLASRVSQEPRAAIIPQLRPKAKASANQAINEMPCPIPA